jgi:hypothetical protein
MSTQERAHNWWREKNPFGKERGRSLATAGDGYPLPGVMEYWRIGEMKRLAHNPF